MKHQLRRLALAALLATIGFGCSSIEERRKESRSAEDRAILDGVEFTEHFEEETKAKTGHRFDPSRLRPASVEDIERLGLKRGEYALRVDRTLMYPCQWLRAEQLATALEPILQAQHGSTARVIPNPETNYLFIYIPPPGERQATRQTIPPSANTRARPLGRTTQGSTTNSATRGRAAR